MGLFATGAQITAALIDAYVDGKYGGAGHSIDWDHFREGRVYFRDAALILAGGLTPDNIAMAIATAQPDGVDVASGVETTRAKKDPELMRRFVQNAGEAFGRLGGSEVASH
jgi:phosphoribosylanthranilate isomerase